MLSNIRCSPCLRSDLRLAAIGEQLSAGDETGVIGRKEQRRAGDLVRISNPAERQFRCHLIKHALLRRPIITGEVEQTRRLGRAGAQYVDPDPAFLEIKRPVTGEAAQRSLGCAVDAEGRHRNNTGGRR